MPVEFHLLSAEEAVRKAAADFAAGPLEDVKKTFMNYQQHQGFSPPSQSIDKPSKGA